MIDYWWPVLVTLIPLALLVAWLTRPSQWRRIIREEREDWEERRRLAELQLTRLAFIQTSPDEAPMHGIESDGNGGWRRF